MSLAIPEDAASVLEQFVHDVANTPAEITHLLEEIQAKDIQIGTYKDEITKRDAQLQKWIRLNGGQVAHPKEEAFAKTINDCYDKCELLQAQKEGLAAKALVVLERQIKRLDLGLRGLSAREEFPADWGGPSLLSASGTGVSTPITGVGAPLQPVSGNAVTTGGAPNIANAAQLRMAQAAGAARTGVATPTANMSRHQREGSADNKNRRRVNATLGSLPTSSSNLRQSSLGPGTPKAGTPGPATNATSRQGSAQPGTRPAVGQKKAPAPTDRKRLAPPRDRKRVRTGGGHKKAGGDRKRALATSRATPSTNASTSDRSSASASPTPSSLPRSQADGASDRVTRHTATAAADEDGDVEMEEDEEDLQLYCTCQKVSFGNMVGCDNEDCRFQWFHWTCVGVSREPKGEWLCPECRKFDRSQLTISKA